MSEQQLHERLRELLGSARAESCQVVATFLDIGASQPFLLRAIHSTLPCTSDLSSIPFCQRTWSDTVFFKPTGDGLLLIHELPSNSGSSGNCQLDSLPCC